MLKYTLIQYIGFLFSLINAVFLFPKLLSAEELGFIRLAFSFSMVAAHIAQFGSNNIMIRFHEQMKGKNYDNTLLNGALFVTMGLFVTIFLLLLGKSMIIDFYDPSSKFFSTYFYWLFLFISSIVFYDLMDAYLSIFFKNSFTAFLKFILLRLLHLFVIIAYALDQLTFDQFFVYYISAQMFIALLSFSYIAYLGKLSGLKRPTFGSLLTLARFSSFGLFIMLSNLSYVLVDRLDVLMLGGLDRLDAVAIYSVAFSLCIVLAIPSTAISRTLAVLMAKAFHENDSHRLKTLYKKSAIHQLFFGVLAFILIILNYDQLLALLPTEYHVSKHVFLYLGLAKIVHISLGANGTLIVNSRYYKWDTFFAMLLVGLTAASNYLLIPSLGVIGAALATLISTLSFNLIKLVFVLVKLRMSPFSLDYFKLLIVSTLSYFIAHIVSLSRLPAVDAVIKSGMALCILIGLSYFLKLSPEINRFINKLLQIR